jgi:hypothetical protein
MVPLLAGSAALVLWNLELARQTRRGLVPPDRLVSFREVSETNARELYRRFGYPFAAPANWIFAWRFGVSPEKFDRIFGHEGFGNFRMVFDETSEPFVARGFGAAELDGHGRPFRWSVGGKSEVFIPLRAARDYELVVEARAFPETLPNELRLSVNRAAQPGRLLKEPDSRSIRWALAAELWRRGINVVSFSFARTQRPSEAGASGDSRELGVAFYRMELLAVPE